jgi:protease-4
MPDQTIETPSVEDMRPLGHAPQKRGLVSVGGYLQRAALWLVKLLRRLWIWTAYAIGSLVLGLLVLGIILGLLMGSNISPSDTGEEVLSGQGADKIAVIPLDGEIVAQVASSPFGASAGVTLDALDHDLHRAENDSAVKAVILHINSPGGSVAASEEMYQRLRRFRTQTEKPVVAYFGDVAASGGYYIAAPSNKIVANPSTLTGSIGAIMEFYNGAGLLEKVGVSAETIKSGTFKDIGSPTRDTTPEERIILQAVVNDAYTQFLDRIVEGRKMDMNKLKPLADGRVYTGNQAKANGLVDEVGDLEKAVSVAKSESGITDATVVRYGQGSWLDQILSAHSSQSLLPKALGNALTPQAGGLKYVWRQ